MKLGTYNQKPEAEKKQSLFHVSCFMFRERGFALLESIVAVTLFTVGVSVAINLISSSLANAGTRTRDKIIAGYLAQEGIEAVRSIRDNNWIDGNDWLSNITSCTTVGCVQSNGCIAWNDSFNGDKIDFSGCSHNLIFDSAAYPSSPAYNPTAGTAQFSRSVDAQVVAVDATSLKPTEIQVTSTVTCGRNCSVSLSEFLYNWK